jgi:hypothetical protein
MGPITSINYIMTQQNQLGTVLGNYMDSEMMPAIVNTLKQRTLKHALR